MELLLANAAATLYLTGLIWFVQVVHYPLFAGVGEERCVAYVRRHTRLTGYVVVVPMLVELISAMLLVAWRPGAVSLAEAKAGLLLVVLIWASTFLLQVPCHRRLSGEYSESVVRRLVTTNWVRTVLWSARAVLVVWWLARLLEPDRG